jgi:hypothetical protein
MCDVLTFDARVNEILLVLVARILNVTAPSYFVLSFSSSKQIRRTRS